MIKVQVIEERVDMSNNMTGRQMIGVGVRRVVLARGELDKLEGPQYAARRAELRREAGEAARARDRQAAVALQNEAEESGATEEEATGARTTRVGRPRGHDADSATGTGASLEDNNALPGDIHPCAIVNWEDAESGIRANQQLSHAHYW